MGAKYEFIYLLAILFCMASTMLIISKLSYNVVSATEIKRFRLMTAPYLVYLVLEAVWILSVGELIFVDPRTGNICKIIDTMMIPLMVYFWLIFAATRFHAKWVEKPLYRLIALIPVMIMTLLYIVSIKNGLVMTIDSEGNLVEGPLVALTGIIDNIYGIFLIIYALVLLSREKFEFRKKEYIVQIIFILICTFGGIMDAAMSMTPVMPLAINLSFIYLFTNILEGQIFNDALTGLNNRRRADRYIADSIASSSTEQPSYLFLMDINKFKSINDTFGHLEGDRALILVADAMRSVAGKYRGLLSRWGGDEFMAVLRNQAELDPDDFIKDIDTSISAKATAILDYDLSVSVGYAKCDSSDVKEAKLIAEADRMMYEKKGLLR